MEDLEKLEKKFKVTKGIGLIIFGIIIFSIGYIVSDAGKSYSMITFLMIYLFAVPAFLIGLPIAINEKFPKFSDKLVLITGLTLIIAYGIFMLYTLINH